MDLHGLSYAGKKDVSIVNQMFTTASSDHSVSVLKYGDQMIDFYEYLAVVEDEHGCLIPTQNVSSHGGQYLGVVKGKRLFGTRYAHRAAFIVAHGSIPTGHEVSHECGADHYENKHCVNRDHLFARTHSENHRYMHPEMRKRISSAGGLASPTKFKPGVIPWNKKETV